MSGGVFVQVVFVRVVFVRGGFCPYTHNCMNIRMHIPVRKCINYISLNTFFLAIFTHVWSCLT